MSRIPRKIAEFAAYMVSTDTYQTTTTNFTRWGWSAVESAQWHTFRTQSDALYAQYSEKKHRTTDIKDQMHKLVNDTIAYDQTHHLLDRIASTPMPPAIMTDFEMFHIKKGTPLQDTTLTRSSDMGMKKPVLTVKKITHLQQQFTVNNPDKPKSKGLPKGIKFAKVYRYIGTTPPVNADVYKFIGNAKRGLIISTFEDADGGKTVWHIARYESNTGVLGQPSEAVSTVVA